MTNFKFIAFIPSRPSCFQENNLTAHAHVTFSAQADIPFRLHGRFADFSARLPRLRILARFQKPRFRARIFSPGWNLLHIISTFISRGFLSEPGLKFQPVHPGAIECIERQRKNFLENFTWSELAKQLTRSIYANRPINFPSHIKHCW